MAENEKLVTAQVLAEALDLSVETVWRYTREDRIPHVQLGKRQYRYRLEDVLAALGDRTLCEEAGSYQVDSGKELTYDDYLRLPDEPGYRLEILDGMLIKEPSPNVMHQRVSRRLYQSLKDYFGENDPEGEVFYAPLDVVLGDKTVVQPDLFCISGCQKQIVKEKCIDGAPRLVLEIISPSRSRKDRLQKLQIYQKAGVRHYWIVDPEQRTLECLSLRDSAYAVAEGGMEDDVVCPPDFPQLTIDLQALWR